MTLEAMLHLIKAKHIQIFNPLRAKLLEGA